ncbi:hypothetical protein P153DRAFT_390499 [Dothidotthia symphoricarpi CBS 119687]|uniref:Uncharacterized protein n=1 Tax=Dothidotthia symphoricarpi CBS 119687 TaxID=1392245 RepID=A0A6A5ZZK7_9PLEO|nr:uncharacterized protein P153DRAFT_390499 [Dothidotthia symphoricarpi CBS 119687]KAF2124455.1 hypothetical protein P153DRAFT_390499 [Dothidotthia symphoricarpi CBS 119687]
MSSSPPPPPPPAAPQGRGFTGDGSSSTTASASTATPSSEPSSTPLVPPPVTPQGLMPTRPVNIVPASVPAPHPASSSRPSITPLVPPPAIPQGLMPTRPVIIVPTSVTASNSGPTPIVQQGSKATRNSKTTTPYFLDTSYPTRPNAGGLHFSSLQEAQKACDRVMWRGPADDTTVPQTDADCQKHVRQLVEAFKSVDDARDRKTGCYIRRFLKAGSSSNTGFYPDWTIEVCAWMILGEALKIYINGFNGPVFDKELLSHFEQSREMTFQDRIQTICNVLKTTKNIAVTLLKGEKILTLVGSPQKLLHAAETNAKSNANRNEWVKIGRKADPNYKEGTTTKRRKRNTTSASGENAPSATLPLSADYIAAQELSEVDSQMGNTISSEPADVNSPDQGEDVEKKADNNDSGHDETQETRGRDVIDSDGGRDTDRSNDHGMDVQQTEDGDADQIMEDVMASSPRQAGSVQVSSLPARNDTLATNETSMEVQVAQTSNTAASASTSANIHVTEDLRTEVSGAATMGGLKLELPFRTNGQGQ